MGNKLESKPILKGETVSFKDNIINDYFNRTNTIIKKYYIKNIFSDNNLLKSLELKSFTGITIKPDRRTVKDISWIDYLIEHLNKVIKKYFSNWAIEMLSKIEKDKDNFLLLENKYFSDFFYNEYQLKTIPDILEKKNNEINENILNSSFGGLNEIMDTLFNRELIQYTESKNFSELDVIDNLGGSYLELNIDDLLPEDPTIEYTKKRNYVKKYIKLFREHIYDNTEHPINQIIAIFSKLFCKYIQDKLKEFKKTLIKQQRQSKIFQEYNNNIKDFEEEITTCFQDFIAIMHSIIKLFYSTSIDLSFFKEEKDDLLNMITSLFFKTGRLYETLLNLYTIAYSEDFRQFQDKLIELKSVKLKDLDIPKKFWLDEDTIALQKSIRDKALDNKKNKDFLEKKEINKKLYPLINNISFENNINSNNNKNKKNGLYKITEEENEENNNIVNNSNINNSNINNKNNNNNIITTKTKSKNNNIPENEDSDYLLENLPEFDISLDKNDLLSQNFNQIRNTVNSFNSKQYLFPKLHIAFKQKENKINKLNNKIKINKEELNIPYVSAINLLKSIKKYRTPFEKIILIAALSDKIMESATSFWNEMQPYIDKDYLFIEADEIMTIFLYIIIQCQMPELLLYCKIINNFTTQFTKGFSISYNYTMLEISMDYITGLKDIQELKKKDNGFKDTRQSLMDISFNRMSRITVGPGQLFIQDN